MYGDIGDLECACARGIHVYVGCLCVRVRGVDFERTCLFERHRGRLLYINGACRRELN